MRKPIGLLLGLTLLLALLAAPVAAQPQPVLTVSAYGKTGTADTPLEIDEGADVTVELRGAPPNGEAFFRFLQSDSRLVLTTTGFVPTNNEGAYTFSMNTSGLNPGDYRWIASLFVRRGNFGAVVEIPMRVRSGASLPLTATGSGYAIGGDTARANGGPFTSTGCPGDSTTASGTLPNVVSHGQATSRCVTGARNVSVSVNVSNLNLLEGQFTAGGVRITVDCNGFVCTERLIFDNPFILGSPPARDLRPGDTVILQGDAKLIVGEVQDNNLPGDARVMRTNAETLAVGGTVNALRLVAPSRGVDLIVASVSVQVSSSAPPLVAVPAPIPSAPPTPAPSPGAPAPQPPAPVPAPAPAPATPAMPGLPNTGAGGPAGTARRAPLAGGVFAAGALGLGAVGVAALARRRRWACRHGMGEGPRATR